MAQPSNPSPLADQMLRLSSHRAGRALVLAVAGEIDAFTAPKLDSAIDAMLEQVDGPVVVDLADVQFLASAGIAVLHNAVTRAAQQERPLRLVVGNATSVLRPLQVLGLTGSLPLHASVRQAIASLPP